MERQIVGKRPTFSRNERRSNFYRVMLLISLILGGVWLLIALQRGQVVSPLQPTPTPTRNVQSYLLEAEAYFDAGKLYDPDPPQPAPPNLDAIDTYIRALELDPDNPQVLAELARIQAYSSSLLRNDTERRERLAEAKVSADRARELAPDDSTVLAIRAFVLDWYASYLPTEERRAMLAEAESEAVIAFQRDPNNPLALAYYAEVLADQQKWLQAEKYALQALEIPGGADLMDTHRVYGYVEETLANYNTAIQAYQKAAEITPNLTFLYIIIGQNFRDGIKNPEQALSYFDRAARINEQLGVQNPIPYLEIAKTYTQEGEFFAASINAEKALDLDPYNASTYGQLGIIFKRARNYEGSMDLLKCAVLGCTAEENEMGEVAVEGLPMTNQSVAWYYAEYGTVLAFLSRPQENYCSAALPVLAKVRQTYPDAPDLMGVVEDSEGICRRLGNASAPTPTVAPELTATPAPEQP